MDNENKKATDDRPNYLPVHVPRHRKLTRSAEDKIFLGLCGGIAERLNIESTLIRILFILSILIGGWGLILYLIAAMLIPKPADYIVTDIEEQVRIRRTNSKTLLGGTLMLVGFFFTFNIYGIIQYFTFVGLPPIIFWACVLIGSGIFFFTKSSGSLPGSTVKKFLRDHSNRRIAGICGGLAAYLNIDSNMCRMIWIIFSFVTLGVGVVLYIIIWLMIPTRKLSNE